MKFNLSKDEAAVGSFSRQVVLKRASLVAAVVALLHYAQAMGWITPDLSKHAYDYVSHGFDVAGFLAGIFYVRAAVTPADMTLSPKSKDGNLLTEVPADAPQSVSVDQKVSLADVPADLAAAPAPADPGSPVVASDSTGAHAAPDETVAPEDTLPVA